MGVYIPPGSGSNGSNNDDDDKDKKKFYFGRSSNGKNKIIFYNRPSVGLKIWGPLVPASDYLPGLYTLTGLQLIVSGVMIRNVRMIWHVKTPFARFSKFLSTAASGYLVFNSGLEVSRLTLPYDPWFEEAREARIKAKKEGENVNFWFGPWDLKPMSFKEWNVKVDQWILKTESEFERQANEIENGDSLKTIDFSSANPMLHQAYLDARHSNQQRKSEILQQLQNKNAFKDILPNYQTYSSFPFEKQVLNLPEDNHLEDDFDLDEAWELNDPWINLGNETSHVVRFIPKFRWIEKIQEPQETKIEKKKQDLKEIKTETGVQQTEI